MNRAAAHLTRNLIYGQLAGAAVHVLLWLHTVLQAPRAGHISLLDGLRLYIFRLC